MLPQFHSPSFPGKKRRHENLQQSFTHQISMPRKFIEESIQNLLISFLLMGSFHVHGPFLFLFSFLFIFPITSSSSDSQALLKLKRSFTNATALDSWKPGTEPCDRNREWVGVICENGLVSGLRLGHLGLSGKIDVDALSSLSGLRSIGIMSNAFWGPIPDFHRMRALRALYLTRNQFSGEIPSDYFSTMLGLKKIWLSGNKFSGQIPYSLVQPSNLMELHLENNQFSGPIPPLDQKTLESVDFSNNNLQGEIPDGLSKFGNQSFQGNAGLCGSNIGRPCNPSASNNPSSGISATAITVSVCFLAASAVVLALMVVGILVMKKRQDNLGDMGNDSLDDPLNVTSTSAGIKDFDTSKKGFGSAHRTGSSRKGSIHGKGVGDLVVINDDKGEFGLADLMKAAAEVLGNGVLGSSYKAMMGGGLTVVVKRIKEVTKMGRDQFDVEVRRLGNLRHKNVLPPLAYHYRKDEKLLVYEYQPKSLLFLLHGDRGVAHSELNWPVRYKIIMGIAQGLDYLHAELSMLDLPHGDLKSSNVLLTQDYEPLLADYGFCSLISSSQAAQVLTAYKAPEAILDHHISPKCDVYCLGIIILEILTGKFPSQYQGNGKGGTDLVQWVRSEMAEGRGADLFDPDIANDRDSLGEMEQLLHIGTACTESNPDHRLDLREAIARIENVRPEGSCQGSRSFHVLPSLRDGYADQSTVASQPSGSEQYHDDSGRGHDSMGDKSRHQSFAFDIS